MHGPPRPGSTLKCPREEEEEEGGEEGAELPRFLHTAASSPAGTRCVSGFSQPGRRGNPGNPQTGCHRQVFVGQRRLAGSNFNALLSRETLFICCLKQTAKETVISLKVLFIYLFFWFLLGSVTTKLILVPSAASSAIFCFSPSAFG